MEQNDELQGCVFAVPSKTPWITSKPLVHKKNQHSEEYLRMKRTFEKMTSLCILIRKQERLFAR